MDFGAFILCGLDALCVLLLAPYVLYVFVKRKPYRLYALYVWGATGAFLVVAGVYIYKVYYLDEGFVVAAMNGDTAQAKYLLAHGADPNARSEDGRTAIECARQRGLTTLVAAIEAAGGRDKGK